MQLTLDSPWPEHPEALTSADFDPSIEAWAVARAAAENVPLDHLIMGIRRRSAWPSIVRLWIRARRRETAPRAQGFRDAARRGWTYSDGTIRPAR
jgi:hypothetical protein